MSLQLGGITCKTPSRHRPCCLFLRRVPLARVGEPRLAADRPPVARVIVIADLLNLRHNVWGTTRTEPTLDEA